MNNRLDMPYFVQYKDAAPRKHRDRVVGRSITWTEKAALQDTECAHPDCSKPASDGDAPIPMCQRHTTAILYWAVRAIRTEVDAATVMVTSIAPVEVPEDGPSVVYYARIGSTIKIGTTTQPRYRMRLLKAEMLAYESGSFALEAERHREYAFACSHNEIFHPSPELIEWIKVLRGEVPVSA